MCGSSPRIFMETESDTNSKFFENINKTSFLIDFFNVVVMCFSIWYDKPA